jgi:mono/diheme cytochrome c family protein
LAAAGTTGTAGQDLDETRPSYELVIQRVTKGGGAMPSFAGSLSRRQIEVIARYVARSAG